MIFSDKPGKSIEFTPSPLEKTALGLMLRDSKSTRAVRIVYQLILTISTTTSVQRRRMA